MDAYVQFARNALCTIKNFDLFGDTFLYDPKVTSPYYSFPPPLDETTPLEFLIAMTQFYAFVSVSLAGYRMIVHSGVNKLRLLGRLASMRVETSDEKKKKKNEEEEEDEKKDRNKKKEKSSDSDDKSQAAAAAASRLVTESIFSEADASSRSAFVGANVLVCGLAFFWLFANSFHLTKTTWIGGTAGLVHSLTVMELGLVVFLYYMAKDAVNAVRRSRRMADFVARIAADAGSSKGLTIADVAARGGGIAVEEYGWLVGGWSPFWSGVVVSSGIPDNSESKLLAKEEEAVSTSLSRMIDVDVVNGILARSHATLLEGYREYLYLVLNFFAFYGYLACILVYYHPDEISRPGYVRSMLFGMRGADADWLGNAVGDFMWTIEPIIILTSPMIIDSLSPKKKKRKEKKEKLS